MGCVNSKEEEEETLWRCRERRGLMKKLLICRSELAAAHMAYLQSLRNTGATLRQFAEAQSDVPGNSHPLLASPSLILPPPPPPPLSPSPPPPHLSLCKKIMDANDDDDCWTGICTDDDDNESCIPPPLPIHSSSWNFFDPYGIPPRSNHSSMTILKKDDVSSMPAVEDEEKRTETSTEFGDEDHEEGKGKSVGSGVVMSLIPLKEKSQLEELTEANSSSMVSGITKETDTSMVMWWGKRTFLGLLKDIDDYFLKAAAGGSDVLVLLESTCGQLLESNLKKTKGKISKSAKVLSWSWPLRSSNSNRGVYGQNWESFSPSRHRVTLEGIYAEEVKLYKEVKEDMLAKVQLKKKISLLENLVTIENDHRRSEKLQSDIETLQTQNLSLQESIYATCLSISKLRDEELHPQLLELISGLSCMWRIMYECHQLQNHIFLKGNLLDNHLSTEPITDSHRFATVQLENEVVSWHRSFCSLLISLREYSHVLNQWVKLTDCLPYTDISGSIKKIHSICDEWQLALDRLPDKVVADSIKTLISVIHSIVLQQNTELNQQKKLKKLENRLEKELNSINQTQTLGLDDKPLSSNAKLDALRKRVEEENAKYMTSICLGRSTALRNLSKSLQNIFQALVVFSNAFLQVLNSIVRPVEAPTEC